MEDKRNLKKLSGFILGILLVFPVFVYAYSDETTHPALTSESVKLFNDRNLEYKLSGEEVKLMMQGSINEDDFTRPMQHFYDPIHQAGLVLPVAEFKSAPEWAYDTKMQAAYTGNFAKVPGLDSLYGTVKKTYSADTDYSWERAIYEYAWGDKERALETLGHILHLAQDMSVPAHTRNDPHPHFAKAAFGGPSPYEDFAAQFTLENIVVANAITESTPEYDSLEEYLKAVAGYSNGNFFSKDSTPEKSDGRYNKPSNLREEQISGSYKMGYAEIDGKIYRLSLIEEDIVSLKKKYFIRSDGEVILSDYWNLLSKQAVLNGAGIIELFFKKVAEERETKELALKNRDWTDKIYDKTASVIYNITDGLYGISVPYEELNTPGAESVKRDTGERVRANVLEAKPQEILEVARADAEEAEQAQAAAEQQPSVPEQGVVRDTKQDDGAERTPEPSELRSDFNSLGESGSSDSGGGSGGSGGGYAPSSSGGSSSGGGSNGGNGDNGRNGAEDESAPSDTTPPAAPYIDGISTSSPKMVVGTTTTLFIGTAEATSTIEAVYNPTATTTVNENGEWTLALRDMPQGTTTIAFTAIDAAGNRSTSTDAVVFVDSEAPPVTAEIEQCGASTDCLAATTTLAISWRITEPADDFSHFVINANGAISTTTATTTTATSTEYARYSFAVSARDTHGNASATTTISAQTTNRPVIINEVAWMGTEASASDEWIELYNPTEYDVNLDNWILHAEDNKPYIEFDATETIPAGGYYLLERKDDETVSDIPADLIYGNDGSDWAMNNRGGDLLTLEMPTGIGTSTIPVDVAPADGGGYYPWCAGSRTTDRTMERISPLHPGSDCNNWSSAYREFIVNGVDSDGNAIFGTPGKHNTANLMFASRFKIADTVVLTAEESPYFVGRYGAVVPAGKTLKAGPGVVIKLASPNTPQIKVSGTIHLEGEEGNPVVVTSFYDDEYGGDMNGDGICESDNASSTAQCPGAGSWKNIFVENADASAVFRHVIVRYGGKYFNNMDSEERTLVGVSGTPAEFSNVVIEESYRHGLYLLNATSTVRDSVFRNNKDHYQSHKRGTGLYAAGTAPVAVKNNLFEGNDYGIRMRALATVTNNTFTNNNILAAEAYAPGGTYRGNSGSGNALNAIRFSSDKLTETGATTTLAANGMAYLAVGRPTRIVASSTLAFKPGVVVKFRDDAWFAVQDGGRIYHGGDSEDEVIFTSRHDDTVGGQTDKATSTEPSAGDWYGIQVNAGGQFNMSGFTLRYAGDERGNSGIQVGGIQLDDGAATSSIANAVIENNEQFGVHNLGAHLEMSNVTVRGHSKRATGEGDPAGLYFASGASGALENIVFSGNDPWDIRAETGTSVPCTNCTVGTTFPADLLE